MTKTKVFIACPTYQQAMLVPCVSSLFSLSSQLAAHNIDFTISTLSLSDVSEARNTLASDFLRSDATHLLFVDADGAFPGEAVVDSLQQNKPIISVLFSGKKFDWDRVSLAVHLGVPAPSLNELAGSPVVKGDVFELCRSDYTRLDRVGMGLTLIQRSAVEKVRDSFPDIEYRKPDSPHTYWNFYGRVTDPATQYLLSEDYSWAHRAALCGVLSYISTRFRTEHYGLHGFVFNKAALLDLNNRLKTLIA